jgi:two-component system KDP operon response regulator KdpE
VAPNPRVLIVEDEAGLRLTLSDRLGSEGYSVETASDGEAGLARATSGGYDLIVLDVMLPRMNGFDVCRAVRQQGVTTPILMLTARGQVVDKVVGLKLGADDYLTKPFGVEELLARVRAVLRRSGWATSTPAPGVHRYGPLEIDVAAHLVRRDGVAIHLTPTEFALLEQLVTHPNKLLSHQLLLQRVWGSEYRDEAEYLRVYMGRLRRKLERDPANPRYLQTEPGVGYRFVP